MVASWRLPIQPPWNNKQVYCSFGCLVCHKLYLPITDYNCIWFAKLWQTSESAEWPIWVSIFPSMYPKGSDSKFKKQQPMHWQLPSDSISFYHGLGLNIPMASFIVLPSKLDSFFRSIFAIPCQGLFTAQNSTGRRKLRWVVPQFGQYLQSVSKNTCCWWESQIDESIGWVKYLKNLWTFWLLWNHYLGYSLVLWIRSFQTHCKLIREKDKDSG